MSVLHWLLVWAPAGSGEITEVVSHLPAGMAVGRVPAGALTVDRPTGGAAMTVSRPANSAGLSVG